MQRTRNISEAAFLRFLKFKQKIAGFCHFALHRLLWFVRCLRLAPLRNRRLKQHEVSARLARV